MKKRNARRGFPFRVDWRLCLVADAEAAAGKNLSSLVRQAVSGGVTLVQLRAKKLAAREFLALAETLIPLLKHRRIPLIINDRVDIAQACGADGVHLGQEDIPCRCARRLLGPDVLIGLSVSTVEEAVRAQKDGADYLGVGPIYPTLSKETTTHPLGPERLAEIRSRVDIPILAIGGIRPGNAAPIVAAGADGLAVISAVLSAADPERAAAEFQGVFPPR